MKKWILNTLALIIARAFLVQTSMVFAMEDVEKQTSCAKAAVSQTLDLDRGDLLKVLEVQKEFPMLNQRLKEMEIGGEFGFVQTAERIVKHLVDTKQMTQEMGNEIFANKILSEYSPIFLKFILAELYSRNYNRVDIRDLLESYDGLLDRTSQLDIARGVIKKMLLFVNESPGVSGPEGLRHFKFMSSVLSVPEPAYKNFLKMWRYLVSSRLDLLMEYTLLQLQYLSSEINMKKQDLENSRASIEASNYFFGSFRKRPRLVEIDKELDALVNLNVDPLLVGEKFGFNVVLKSTLPGNIDRVTEHENTVNEFDYLQGVFDSSSSLVREYIFYKVLPHLSLRVLKAFIDSSMFESFSSSFKENALKEYEKLESLRQKLIEISSLLQGGENKHLIGNITAILERYNTHLEGFAKLAREFSEKSGLSVNSVLEELILKKKSFMEDIAFRLSSTEYFEILISTISMTMLSQDIRLIEKVLGYLSSDAENYKFSDMQRDRIINLIISSYAYENQKLVQLNEFSQLDTFGYYRKWGFYDGALARMNDTIAVVDSIKIRQKIPELRSYLSKEEALLTDSELYSLVSRPSITRSPNLFPLIND